MRHALLLVLAGCPAVQTPPPAPVTPIEVELLPGRIEAHDLRLARFAVGEIEFTPWETGGGVAAQGIEKGDDRIRWVIRGGPGESLRGFVDDHRSWRMRKSHVTVCGRRVPAWIAERPAEHITCVMTATGNFPAYNAPRRAIGFAIRDELVASFEIEAEDPRPWQHTVDTIIASITCH